MPETMDTRLSRLRDRAERALASGRRGGDVLTVLETMTREAPDGSAHALFAHRHLAELQLSGSPWRAALHLRRLVQAGAADDSAHALMGLSQALLGNYRMAVAAYRKAIKLAPRNPWYHHNLGHLLDVGLSDSAAALDHLRMAQRIQPDEDEIAASLAHCLARLGRLPEAEGMAALAVRRAPRNREHQALLEWVKAGAPPNVAPSARTDRRSNRADRHGVHLEPPAARSAGASGTAGITGMTTPADYDVEPSSEGSRSGGGGGVASSGSSRAARGVQSARGSQSPQSAQNTHQNTPDAREGEAVADPVIALLEEYCHEQADAERHMERARVLWTDFCSQRSPRVAKPATYAAALEYTLSKLEGGQAISQAAVARRYKVTAKAVASRHEEIRATLSLEPGDTRYSERALSER
jgi:hypothetical protein